MYFFMRIVRPLLEQRWAFPVTAALSGILLVGGAIGLGLHWPYYLRLLFWGVAWGLVAIGAWAMNR